MAFLDPCIVFQFEKLRLKLCQELVMVVVKIGVVFKLKQISGRIKKGFASLSTAKPLLNIFAMKPKTNTGT